MKLSNRGKVLLGVAALLLVGGFFLPNRMAPISLPAEVVARPFGFPLTNTILAAWLSMLVLLTLTWRATRAIQLVPRGAQNFVEAVIEAGLSVVEGVAGKENGRRFFPLVITIFLFIVTSNWMGLLPGYGTIGVVEHPHEGAEDKAWTFQPVHLGPIDLGIVPLTREPADKEHPEEPAGAKSEAAKKEDDQAIHGILVPFLRSANTDLNMTLALALVTMAFVEFWGVAALGFLTYISRFVNLRSPIDFAIGLIEIVSEAGRVISFTFRLFGNIFAGEVLLAVIGFLVPMVAVLPFFGLELFVGFVQALVFSLLALAFATMAVISHGEHEHGEAHAPAQHH
ncbi:MAG: F0F1 ATP synthase subunit A [Chloroflexi bacterium]|nr:F0F1 ATP synthase subunit A [Chloroflexota bacterium]